MCEPITFSYRSVQPVYSVRWYKVRYRILMQQHKWWSQVNIEIKFPMNCLFLEWEGVLQLQTRKTQPHHCPQSPRHQCWCEWAKCDSICKNLSVVEIEITSRDKFFHIATNETLQLTNQLLSLNHLTLKYLAMFLFRWPSPTFVRWVVFLPTGCPKNVLQDQNLEPVSSWDSINTRFES